MPVTQPTRELKPAPEVEHPKSHKVLKQPLKIHADFKSQLPQVEKIHREDHTSDAARRRPRSRTNRHYPRYHYPDAYSRFFVENNGYGRRTVPHLTNTYLRPNAKFVGEQQSGAARYDIKVELKTVDLVSLVVTGFFQISGLTDEHPLITTCFKGEIINNPLHRLEWGDSGAAGRYLFITEQRSWGSFPKNDMDHWRKLTGSPASTTEEELAQKLQRIHAGEHDTQYVYMRWKEEFLLPDLRIKLLKGASFEGFYYVVLNIGAGAREQTSDSFSADSIPGTINGLYFHTQSDKFQSLLLRYVEDRGVSHAFEFA